MRRKRAAGSSPALATIAWLAVACGEPEVASPVAQASAASDDHGEALLRLVEYEERKRAALDHAAAGPWSRRAGSDPFALLPTEGGGAIGLERAGRLVRLAADASVLAAGSTLPGATGLLEVGNDLLVVAEGDGRIDVIDAATLASRRRVQVEGVASIRAAAYGPEGALYLADPHRHRVLAMRWPQAGERAAARPIAACGGALDVRRVGMWLVAACLLDHTVLVRHVGEAGELGPVGVVRHDGPIWSVDAVPRDKGGLRLLLGGVEDRALDRSDGAFGYVDSFAFVVEVDPADADAAPVLRRASAINLSELGIVTPKHVAWLEGSPLTAIATGYGTDKAATLAWPDGLGAPPTADVVAVVPGIVDIAGDLGRCIAASPLLDAWVVVEGGHVTVRRSGTDTRTPSERLGEALAFTTAMAPHAISTGQRSRFTCETCHFEGHGDGRTHFTGRGEVHATTKTLRGLFPNRPHFSRALDRTTARMVHNEFAVANRGTGFDPWFSLSPADAPWIAHLAELPDPIDAEAMRRALIDFLAVFTPEPNPAVRGRVAFDASEREGAQLFLRHCESCHAARLVADDAATRVAPERWEGSIFSEGSPIVWGSDTRVRTGVEPYVHEDGARVPSLRRLWTKRPYLTNGTAATLEDVLTRIRVGASTQHDADEGRALTAAESAALRAFLDVL